MSTDATAPDVRAAVERLQAWLTGRQASVHPEISTTLVRDEPYDRSSSSYTIAESDVRTVLADRDALAARVAELEAALNGSYRERAQLLGLTAVNYPALITEAVDIPCDHRTCEGRHWHLLVMTIDGHQATWHIHPDDMGLWSHVPYVPPDDPRVQWDGHTTEQKYERILEYTVRVGDAAHEAEQAAGDEEAEREAVERIEAPTVPELSEDLLRTLPVPIAAAVHRLKLKHEGQRRRAEAAERRQEELRAEVRRLERERAEDVRDGPTPCPDCGHWIASHYVGDARIGCGVCLCLRSQNDLVVRDEREATTRDAAPDGRRATGAGEEDARASMDGNTSSILPQGLSEPEGVSGEDEYVIFIDYPECPNCGEGCGGHDSQAYHQDCDRPVEECTCPNRPKERQQ